MPNHNSSEYLMEIESLMKTLNVVNLNDIKAHGIIENL